MTDIELVEKFKLWETNIFWEIFEKYWEKTYNFIYFKIFSEELSKEILEKTFLKLIDCLEDINLSESTLEKEIYDIANNKIREELEKIRKNNSDIKIDWKIKKWLKNKLEIISYTKIKNTKNKKNNIANKWFFSFKQDNKNIFEEPTINYKKIFWFIFVLILIIFWILYLDELKILLNILHTKIKLYFWF